MMIGLVALQLSDLNWKQKQQQKVVVVGVVGDIFSCRRRMRVRERVRVWACLFPNPTPPSAFFE